MAAFVNLIDARVFDLYDDPMPDLNELEGYCGETVSALIQLQALVLAGEHSDTGELAGHAGVAYGLTGLMRSIAFHASRGQVYLPGDVLARHGVSAAEVTAGRSSAGLLAALAELRGVARRHLGLAEAALANAPKAVLPAFLSLALVRPVLDRMERRDFDPFVSRIDPPQWLTQWRLWRLARRLG